MFAILFLIIKTNLIPNVKKELDIWAIDIAGEKLHSKIKRKIKTVTIFVIINTFLILFTSLTYVQPLTQDTNIFFSYRLIHDYFPDYSKTLEYLCRFTYFIFGYIMTVHVFQILYCSQHINFQLEILMAQVKNITNLKNITKNEENLFYDIQYQIEIKQRLRFLVKRSQQLVK